MPRYRYTAIDRQGRRITGERDAADPDALVASLGAGIRQIETVQQIELSERAVVEHVSRSAAAEISRHVSELVESQLPLESGLEAVAAECPSRPLRRSLRRIAADLAAGENLESALSRRGVPPELPALVRAGARTGETGRILEHFVTNVESSADLWQALRRGLMYPLVLLLLFGGISIFAMWWVLPQFVAIYEGFAIQLPAITLALVTTSRFITNHGLEALAILLAAVAGVTILLRLLLGRLNWRRVVCRVPLIGPVIRCVAMSKFTQLLSLLIENQVPLEEALTLAGAASGDAEIEHDCRRIVAAVKAGEPLEGAARRLDRFPVSFVQALSWNRHQAGLPELLQSLGDMYAGRVRAAVALLVAFVPPLMVLVLGVAAFVSIIALFLPLVQLLNALS